MSTLAFLGMGAMGSRMAARLVAAGHDVAVWNRTPKRLDSLADLKVTVAETPAVAVRNADVVFAMVRDDNASSTVWLDAGAGALHAMRDDAIGIECSTLSVLHIKKLASEFVSSGRQFLDAPLAGSRPHAEAGILEFYVGGNEETLAQAKPILLAMGNRIHHAGENGSGAALKLMINALLSTQLAQMAELIGFAEKMGLEAESVLDIIGQTSVCSQSARDTSKAMLQGDFSPRFPIELVAKDVDLIRETAERCGAAVPIAEATQRVYASGIARGIGGDNISGVVQLYR